jgi:hypothetical protein
MNHIIAHQTTFLQTKLPISKGAICLDYDDPFQVLVLLVFVFKRPKQNTCVPIVANCPTCKTCFTSEHLSKQTTTKITISIRIQPETINPTTITKCILVHYGFHEILNEFEHFT